MFLNSISLLKNFDFLSFVLFVLILSVFLYKIRKKLSLQKLIFPLFYIILYRSKFGIKFMESFAKKHRKLTRAFGYISIGIGIIGMIVISLNILYLIKTLIFKPEVQQQGVSLVLPFTNVPGIGYLSFWHWLISIFILALIHEFAHGIVAKSYGMKIKSSGFAIFGILLPLIPAAFVEPDEKQLAKKRKAAQYSVFSAGPASNIIFSFLVLALLLLAFNPVESKMTYAAGFSFALVNESFPAAKAGLKDGMVITRLNNKSIDSFADFINYTKSLKPGQKISITADNKSYSIVTAESPYNSSKGFIGIKPLYNERKYYNSYKPISGAFSWLKELFVWLFTLNLFIGLANLMPLGIVDGGRILQIFLLSIMPNKKKAMQLWSFISAMFILFIVFALIANYFGNPFAFIR